MVFPRRLSRSIRCLSGSDDNYKLTLDNGTTYQLTGNTAELKDHVGHEVQIIGKTASSSMASSSAAASQQAVLEVKSIEAHLEDVQVRCPVAG